MWSEQFNDLIDAKHLKHHPAFKFGIHITVASLSNKDT